MIRIFSPPPQTYRLWDFECFMQCFSYDFTEDFYDNCRAVPHCWIEKKSASCANTYSLIKTRPYKESCYACACLCRMLFCKSMSDLLLWFTKEILLDFKGFEALNYIRLVPQVR